MWKAKLVSLVSKKSVQISAASVVSAAAGAASAYYISKQSLKAYYVEISNREIAEAKAFYGMVHKTKSPSEVMEELHGEPVDIPAEAADALVNYQGGHPVSSVIEEEVEVSEERPDPIQIINNIFVNEDPTAAPGVFDYDREVALRTEEAPYIITEEEYNLNQSEYEQTHLVYYEGDDVVVDSHDDPLPEPDDIVGEDHLVRFGHGSNNKDIVYVRNDKLEMDFEITRSEGKYAEEVLGFDMSDELKHSDSRIRRFRRYDE